MQTEQRQLTRGNTKLRSVAVAMIVLVAGTAVFLATTRHGAGLWPDSVTYLEGGEILADEPGSVLSLDEKGDAGRYGHYPPLYSVALAVPAWLGGDVESGVRAVNALLLLATLCGFAYLVARRANWLTGIAASGALVLLGGFVAQGFGWLLSEPLFLMLTALALLTLDASLDAAGNRYWLLIAAAGVFAGAATLTRLVGLGVVLAVVLVLLVYGEPGRKVRAAVVAGAVSLGLVSPWFLAARNAGGDVGDRSFDFHPPGAVKLWQFGRGIGEWFLPEGLSEWTSLLWLGVAVAAAVWAVRFLVSSSRRVELDPRDRLVGELILLSFAYTAAVMVAATFFDPNIPFDGRIFVPMGMTVVAVVALRVTTVWPSIKAPSRRAALVNVLAVLLVIAGLRTVSLTSEAYSHGLGYEAPAWDESPTLAYVAALDPEVRVITNGPDAVWLRLGRQAETVPNLDWPNGISSLQQKMQGNAVVVYFDDIRRSYLYDPEELAAEAGLVVSEDFDDGIVLIDGRS